MSIKRFKTFAIAVLGVALLSVAFAGTAQAEIYMVSPTSVETPAVVVLAAPQSNMSIEDCYQGAPDPNNNWQPAPGTGFEFCEPYLAKRTGPDTNGLYYFRWKLPLSPTGQTVFREVKAWSDDPATGDVSNFSFTVTGNRLGYGDFRTCIHPRTAKALIAYYARRTTEVVFRVEVKKNVSQSDGSQHWVWRPWKSKRALFDYADYGRREVQFKVPVELYLESLPPKEARHFGKYEKGHVRARYLVKQGKKVIKKGYVSRRLCRELPFPPYVLP